MTILTPDNLLAHWVSDTAARLDLSIDRATAFILVAQLQLALRHPDNIGEPAATARHIIQQLQTLMPEEILQLSRLGDDPAFDTSRRCRECGCTQERACIHDGVPCHWVERDLCSACAPTIILS